MDFSDYFERYLDVCNKQQHLKSHYLAKFNSYKETLDYGVHSGVYNSIDDNAFNAAFRLSDVQDIKKLLHQHFYNEYITHYKHLEDEKCKLVATVSSVTSLSQVDHVSSDLNNVSNIKSFVWFFILYVFGFCLRFVIIYIFSSIVLLRYHIIIILYTVLVMFIIVCLLGINQIVHVMLLPLLNNVHSFQNCHF